jgi:hypothetical protein
MIAITVPVSWRVFYVMIYNNLSIHIIIIITIRYFGRLPFYQISKKIYENCSAEEDKRRGGFMEKKRIQTTSSFHPSIG